MIRFLSRIPVRCPNGVRSISIRAHSLSPISTPLLLFVFYVVFLVACSLIIRMTQNPAAAERRQKRKLSNRESARRSRMRKQQRLEYLTSTVVQMRDEKARMVALAAGVTQQRRLLESENSALRAQAVEFAERLQSLSSVLRLVDDVRGAAMEDVSEIPPPVPGLWQSPRPGVPILASADVFECC
ncbi:unnamed protein product [Musa acuminata subsp. burmannicoides]